MGNRSIDDLLLHLAAQSADDNLAGKLIGANLGAVFVVLMTFRRLRMARRGGKRLERHDMWRWAPFQFAFVWLLVAALGVAVIRRDSPDPMLIVGAVTLAAVWLVACVLLWADRRIEHGGPPRRGHPSSSR